MSMKNMIVKNILSTDLNQQGKIYKDFCIYEKMNKQKKSIMHLVMKLNSYFLMKSVITISAWPFGTQMKMQEISTLCLLKTRSVAPHRRFCPINTKCDGREIGRAAEP